MSSNIQAPCRDTDVHPYAFSTIEKTDMSDVNRVSVFSEKPLTCFDKLDDSVKARSQYVHLNGLCPLCVRLWIVKAPVIAKDLPHPGKSHTYGSEKRIKQVMSIHMTEVRRGQLTFLCMPTHMLCKCSRLGKVLLTDLALERPMTCMTLQITKIGIVSHQCRNISKLKKDHIPASVYKSSACSRTHPNQPLRHLQCLPNYVCIPPKSTHSALSHHQHARL